MKEPKAEQLEAIMDELTDQDMALAFSGGVDSSLLLKMAADRAAKKGTKVWAVTFNSRLHPSCDLENARKVAGELGGIHVILEIDVNGALKVMKENDVVSIFIMPPSLEVLEQRLRGRGTETEEVVQQRLNEALTEISKAYEYDYIVVNDNLEDAIAQVKAIIVAEKCKTEQNVELIKGVLS